MKSLLVTVQQSEFAKDFRYFLTCQLDGLHQKRTEASMVTSSPVFADNTFSFPLREPLQDNVRLQFAAFALADTGA